MAASRACSLRVSFLHSLYCKSSQGIAMPVVGDLHCDLLNHLALNDSRTVRDSASRCSVPLMLQGDVRLQTLAIFTETGKNALELARKQLEIFLALPEKYPDNFCHLKEFKFPKKGPIHIALAIENASGISAEDEGLENCFKRLDAILSSKLPLLYVSLTWNSANRFGGGNMTNVGLKPDGETLIDYLNQEGVSVDFSHTSDFLAHDIFNYLDKKGFKLLPVASHSNFRAVADHPRNLTDENALEIARRGGIIGLNFVKRFIGKQFPDDFLKQIEHAKTLGIFDHLVLGADFFNDEDLSSTLSMLAPFFYEPFGNAGCMPEFFAFLQEKLTDAELEKLAHKNLEAYFERLRKMK